MKRILIVDDEVRILKAMSRLFMERDYEIYTAESASQALALLDNTGIDLIISDMRMPLMGGNELLVRVKEKYPEIIRVIISGYADEQAMFAALLHNVAKLYVFKPWNNSELLGNIEKLFSTADILNSPELARLADTIDYRAHIPDNCKAMLDLIEKEDLDALVSAIEKDSEISALLMHVAKCSIYGAMPNSVKLVANYVGLPNLKCFMYWAGITVTDSESGARDNNLAVLWKQSCDTNRILLFLYEAFLHKQPPEAALFAGLLKNIGYILLLRSKASGDEAPLTDSTENTKRLIELEMSDYQLPHQEVGAYYLNKWDLPYPSVEVALYHHRPLDPNIVNTELLACVHIAQYYSWKLLNGGQGMHFEPEVFDRIGITVRDFETKLAKYLK